MSRRVRAGAVSVAVGLAMAVSPTAHADPASAPTAEAAEQARDHYARGKALYAKGAYREALAEIQTAHKLDPTAKQLVFNLAIIHEKLGEIDTAIGYLRDYLKMDLDASERERAESTIRRLEGAKHVGVTPAPSTTSAGDAPVTPPAASAAPPEDKPQPDSPSRPGSSGRFDAATFLTGVGALTALGVGVYFGLRAESDRPTNFVSGVTGTFADFQQRNDEAHREAVVADIALGAGLLLTGLTAYLFFGRSADEARTPRVSFAPTRSGGAVLLGARF